MPLAPRWKTLHEAVALVTAAGQPNLALGVDLLHLLRSGGTPAEVADLDPALVGHAQLCDGASLAVGEDYVQEASASRLAPGRGVFPVRDFVRALPPGTPLELEVPQPPDRPPRERVMEIVRSAREALEDRAGAAG
jgi:sugar phosphate isomerase/epimerase